MKKIKPCPFCGVIPKPHLLDTGKWLVECQNEHCPSKGASPFKEYAVENWNMRYRPPRKEIKNESSGDK